MDKKIILVTGATSGIGREAARVFLAQGHTVVIHGRNRDKALTVRRELAAETGNSDVDVLVADLESLAAVKRLAEEFTATYDRLDVLVNNAGNQYGGTWQATAEGHEKTMAVGRCAASAGTSPSRASTASTSTAPTPGWRVQTWARATSGPSC
ncbi:SDR family NAD(P)-dependent oxidoreductase [Nonomuraea sp. NPDC050451]|uniref:SDR family NAD(P)-dependent oxidoreductase n=1 Tax=Nonomuraea sp. NPDC050451 TaxID=3364364 RepID=UPI0037B7243C